MGWFDDFSLDSVTGIFDDVTTAVSDTVSGATDWIGGATDWLGGGEQTAKKIAKSSGDPGRVVGGGVVDKEPSISVTGKSWFSDFGQYFSGVGDAISGAVDAVDNTIDQVSESTDGWFGISDWFGLDDEPIETAPPSNYRPTPKQTVSTTGGGGVSGTVNKVVSGLKGNSQLVMMGIAAAGLLLTFLAFRRGK